jgi:hypothetical protein
MGWKEDREAWTKHITKAEIAKSLAKTKRSKFGAVRTEAGGRTFASAKEAYRYMDLAMMQAAKQITALEVQPEYPLYVTPSDALARVNVGTYRADFRYIQDGKPVVEDVKSKATATPLYRLKKKIVEALYGIEIREV